MTNAGSSKHPGAGDTSWTNETLPLDVRRELLNQELERFTARRHSTPATHSQAGGNTPSQQHGGQGGQGSSHPSAGGGNTDHS